MKRLTFILAACFTFMAAGGVEAIELTAQSVRTIKIFRNVSGSSQPSGTAYVLQDASTDSNILIGEVEGSESTLGLDVTTTTTADSDDFVGIQLDPNCDDDAYCRVVVYGPAIVRWAGSTDNTNTRLAEVGTTTVVGRLGSGTLAGQLLSLTLSQTTPGGEAEEINGQADSDTRWVFVRPGN